MHTELSEAFEEYRNGKGFNETYYEENNIDLDKIIEEKMEYNKNREFKHNKKC